MWNHAHQDLDQDRAAHFTSATIKPTLGKKTEDSISHACMTPGFGPFFSSPLSSQDINLALLSLVFAVTTQSLGCPCQLWPGVCQGCVSGKMNSAPWRGGGAAPREAKPLLPFPSSHICCRRSAGPREITVNIYLHQEQIHIPPSR